MTDLNPQLAELGVQLAASAARNTASAISDKITALRASKAAGDQVAALEEIVSELIADKNELTRIAQSYQQELIAQQLTPGDVRYITETVVPLLKRFAEGMDDEGEKAKLRKQIETFKPLLSLELITVLQLLGFSFREGIGAPLTQRVRRLIDGSDDSAAALQVESLRAQQAAMHLARDPAAYARFRELYPAP